MVKTADNPIIVFLGAPGAGKGTQASAVAEEIGLKHISSGDMFRRAVERADDLGNTVRKYMENGALVPDEITTRMILDELSASSKGIILDGFPRNLRQAQCLDAALANKHREVDSVIHISVPEGEILRRLTSRWICSHCQSPHTLTEEANQAVCTKCAGGLYQRVDDQPKTVKKRLEVYFLETAPLTEYYRKQGKLLEIEGQGDIDMITRHIVSALTD
jgi:adenylate kinase